MHAKVLIWAVTALCAAAVSAAHQRTDVLVLQDTFAEQTQLQPVYRPRIAVVGAGAAGSSFTHFFDKMVKDAGLAADLVVFDRDQRIGGRAHALQLNVSVCTSEQESTENSIYSALKSVFGRIFAVFKSSKPNEMQTKTCSVEPISIELGASIFAKVNHHLVNASRDFGLDISGDDGDEEGNRRIGAHASFGVWDGAGWRYLDQPPPSPSSIPGWSWFHSALTSFRMLARYGFFNGPIYATRIARSAASAFVQIYTALEQGIRFTDAVDAIVHLGLQPQMESTAKAYMDDRGVSSRFTDEILSGISRVTYLQNVENIRAFCGLIALFSGVDEMYQVRGGNEQIFQRMLQGFDVRLGSTVKSIAKVSIAAKSELLQHTSVSDRLPKFEITIADGSVEHFDAVVIAAPIPSSSIDFYDIDTAVFPKVDYVHLYVTIVVGHLNPSYFGLNSVKEIPRSLMTPSGSIQDIPFYCMSIYNVFADGQVLVKTFSDRPITENELESIFVLRSYTYRHAWDHPGSYPYLPPHNITDDDGNRAWSLPLRIDQDGLYYINAFEGFVSTMETETIAARNVAGLVLDDIVKKN